MDEHRPALNRPPRWFLAVIAIAPALFIAVLYAWPVATLFWTTLQHRAAEGPTFGDTAGIVWFTAWQAAASTVLTLVVGILPAYVLARYSFRGRRVRWQFPQCRSADGRHRRCVSLFYRQSGMAGGR